MQNKYPHHAEVEVLLVEDNPTDAELTQYALKETNFANKTVWVKNGAEALDFIYYRGAYANREKTGKLCVILLDLQLPKVTGIEVLKKLKSDPATAGIPVVILTSSQLDKDIKECYALGVNSYVSKPVEFGEFAEVVAKMGFYWLMLNKLVK